MSEHEEWRPVVGYEGYYEVSSLGRVRSLDRVVGSSVGYHRTLRGVLRKPWVPPNGYPMVWLSVDGVRKYLTVHRLVAFAFVGPPPSPVHEVCHIDGNKLHPRADNLYWGTRAENGADTVRHGQWTNQNVGKTHCKRGHEFTPENTKVAFRADKPGPYRKCRTCARLSFHARKEAR